MTEPPSPPADPSQRWPGWVYRVGTEPDPRFSLANERTFLAWIRTSLALLAAGVALDALAVPFSALVQRGLAGVLVVLGLLCATVSWLRWARAEQALRQDQPLPAFPLGAVLAFGVGAVAVVLLAVIR